MVLTEIKNNELKLKCKRPIMLNYEIKDNKFFYDNTELDIYLCSDSESELYDEFCECILCDYLLFVKDKETPMTNSAREYGKLLQDMFIEIT